MKTKLSSKLKSCWNLFVCLWLKSRRKRNIITETSKMLVRKEGWDDNYFIAFKMSLLYLLPKLAVRSSLWGIRYRIPKPSDIRMAQKASASSIEPWLLPVVLFTTRIFSPNISQLKCSTGRRNVREIKTKCSQKYRDKSSTKTSQPACQLVLKIIKEWKMFQQQPGKYFSCWENISQSLKHFIWK